MHTDNLRRALGAIDLRFGSQAVVRASQLAAATPWATGVPAVDRLSGIGGLPAGRLTVVRGVPGSGRLSLAMALLATATHTVATPVVVDLRRTFDPGSLDRLGADLAVLTLVRPPSPDAAGEAAVALARAGAGFLLVLAAMDDASLGPLESAAARSGCLVVAVDEPPGLRSAPLDASAATGRPLAHASSLTLEVERVGWVQERFHLVGMRSEVRCVKNRVAAPGATAVLEIRYDVAPGLAAGPALREVMADDGAAGRPRTAHQHGSLAAVSAAAVVRARAHAPAWMSGAGHARRRDGAGPPPGAVRTWPAPSAAV